MRQIASAIWVLLPAVCLSAPRPAGAEGSLQLEECQLTSSIVSTSVVARCGWFTVPENREMGGGKQINIHVAVVPALRKQALGDAVWVISGGPGQSATDFYLSTARSFEAMRRERDIVVVDQRGTGKSNRLDCQLPDDIEEATIDSAVVVTATRKCLQNLPGDPRFYSTSDAVRDLEDIRSALGYSTINLYGISYGTRVAQHYLRRFPDRVRTIVLDGVVPVDLALGPEVAPLAQRALDGILRRCANDERCRNAFPAVQDEFERLRMRLARQSITVVVSDPRTAKQTAIDFSAGHLAAAVRLDSYSEATASLLPFLIHEAAQNRPQGLVAQAIMIAHDLSAQIANGMHNAVVCTEDVPFISPESLRDAAIERSYIGRALIDSLLAMCSVWPKGTIDTDFHSIHSSSVPALLLSGENDPVTPASYGERAVRDFSRGKHVVVPGQGHGQVTNPCVARLMSRFVSLGTSDKLDLQCVGQQAAAPFMLNGNSPGP